MPFVRSDVVNLSNALYKNANEQALKVGLNYNLPFTQKLVNLHLEYARHFLDRSPAIFTTPNKSFNEFRLEPRINATRYLRFLILL